MKFNAKKLNLEELLKWEEDLVMLSNKHSCKNLRKRYKDLLDQVKIEIDKRKKSAKT